MVVAVGSLAPGRGKNTERFLEWIRAWPCACDLGEPRLRGGGAPKLRLFICVSGCECDTSGAPGCARVNVSTDGIIYLTYFLPLPLTLVPFDCKLKASGALFEGCIWTGTAGACLGGSASGPNPNEEERGDGESGVCEYGVETDRVRACLCPCELEYIF